MNQGFRQRLQGLLEEQSLTPGKLAKELGVARQSAYNWLERGKISSRNLSRVAEYFKVSKIWLVNGIGSRNGEHNGSGVYGQQARALINDVVHSETLLRLAAKAVGLAIFEYDLYTGTLSWTEDSQRFCELDLSTIYPTLDSFISGLSGSDRDCFRKLLDQHLSQEGSNSEEVTLHLPDGCIRNAVIWLSARLDNVGRPNAIIAAIQDVTEYKQEEEVLRSKERYLAMLLNTVPYGVQDNDVNGIITYSNPAHHRILGYPPEKLIGKAIWDMYTPEESKQGLRDYFAYLVAEQPEPEPYITNVRRQDGSSVDIQVDWTYKRDTDGKLTGFVSIITDISERRRAEAAIRQSEKTARVLIDASPNITLLLDTTGNVIAGNQKLANSLGTSLDEMIGKRIFDFLPPEIAKSRWKRLEEAVQTKKPVQFDDERAGRFFDNYFYPILDDQGQVTRVAIYARDITKQQKSSSRLNRLYRTYAMLTHCIQAMIRANNEPELLDKFCRHIVDTGGYRLTWVGYAERDEQKTVRPVATAGYEKGYVEAAQLSWADNERGRGPGGRAIRTGKPFVVRDVLNDPDFSPWRDDAIQRGYASVAALPLMKEGDVFGAMLIYAHESDAFDEKEIRLLMNLADDLSFGIHAMRDRKDLQRQVQRNDIILGTSPDGFWIVDLEGRLQEVNDAYCKMVGYSREELLSMHVADIEANESPDDVQERMENIICDGYERFESRHRRKNGTLIDMEITASLAELGKQKFVFTFFRDITKRKQAEEALRESKRRLLVSQEIAHVGSWDWDIGTGALTWTDEIYRIFGYPPQSFNPRYESFMESVHPADREKVTDAVESALQNVNPYDIEHRIVRPDGTERVVRESGKVYCNETGTPIRIVGVVQDITEQKQAEEKLRQAATVFESTAEGVTVTDPDGKIIAVNKAFTEITGYSEQEALGKTPRILKSGRHNETFYHDMWASIIEAGQWQGEIWNRRKNGELYPELRNISAVRDEEGTITHYVSVFTDITAMKRSEERLVYLAHHDALTGLPNRLLFNVQLEHALKRAQREKQQVAVLFLDLDRFKNINDSLGHPIGDMVLQVIVDRMKIQLREEDMLARLGGDEFIIVLENIGTRNTATVAQKLMQAFCEPIIVNSHSLHLTASIGISLFPDDGKDVTTLVKNADAAMYRAKERGRNNYQFYTTELTNSAMERMVLENELRQAIERDEFVLCYQPQYSLTTGKLVGAEALIRWQHAEMGLVSPDKFISIAEDTGLILPIGEWVLQTACSQARKWQNSGLPIERIAVNVAGIQIQRGDIVETVRRILNETGLDSRCLELEITETFIMQQTEQDLSVLNGLKDLGVTLAIDDFGTGYSSLGYLKQLPIDKLKVDRTFVRDIPKDSDNEAISRAI